MNTNRVKIASVVVDPYVIHPALTAIIMATIDELSKGRVIINFGAGGSGLDALGIVRDKTALAIKEAVTIIRGLLRGETVDYNGEIVKLKKAPNVVVARARRSIDLDLLSARLHARTIRKSY